jgi:nucleoid-associated protein YejK
MQLEIHQVIVHELIKEPEASEAQLFLSKASLPIDERTTLLLEQLNLAFEQKSDTLQGFFSSPQDALFPGYFQEWANQQFAQAGLMDFSRETMQALQLSLQGITGAKGGYLVYGHYHFFEQDYLGIFLIRDTEGLVFDKQTEDGVFDIQSTTYLNTDRLAMAGRINISRFQQGNQRCLELIKYAKSQKTISEYFQNWIGLDRPESSRALTQTFLEVVNELPLPLKEDSNEKMEEEEFRAEVLNFAMRNPQKTIDVAQFEKTFYGEDPTVQKLIEDQEIDLEDSFRFDQRAIKNYYHYKASAEGLSLSFNHSHYRQGLVEIDGETIVIKSEALAEKLRSQLEQFL